MHQVPNGVHKQQRTRIPAQRLFDHFPRIHRCLAHRAPKHLHLVEHPVLCIQMDHRADFMRQIPQACPQVVLDHRRRRQHVGPTHPARQHPLRGLQYLVHVGRTVLARDMANSSDRARSPETGTGAPQRSCHRFEDGRKAACVRSTRRP